MKAVSRKLRSNRGASIVIALLYFLVAVTVGAIVITAATAGAGKLATIRKQEQAYLSVSSAARMIETGLGESEYNSKTTAGTFPILSEAMRALAGANLHNKQPSEPIAFTVAADGMQTVTGSLAMNLSGSVTVKLWIEDEKAPLEDKKHDFIEISAPAKETAPGVFSWKDELITIRKGEA